VHLAIVANEGGCMLGGSNLKSLTEGRLDRHGVSNSVGEGHIPTVGLITEG